MRYAFQLTEYDRDHRWLVISNERREVELDNDVNFYEWARQQWPGKQFEIRPDPKSVWE